MSHKHHHGHHDGDPPTSPPVQTAATPDKPVGFLTWIVVVLIGIALLGAGGIYVYFRFVMGGLVSNGRECTLDRECESHNCYKALGERSICQPAGYGSGKFIDGSRCNYDIECRSHNCYNHVCYGK